MGRVVMINSFWCCGVATTDGTRSQVITVELGLKSFICVQILDVNWLQKRMSTPCTQDNSCPEPAKDSLLTDCVKAYAFWDCLTKIW